LMMSVMGLTLSAGRGYLLLPVLASTPCDYHPFPWNALLYAGGFR
jgi:hypothetical protein